MIDDVCGGFIHVHLRVESRHALVLPYVLPARPRFGRVAQY
jgi:hypothetical protein